MEPFPRPLLAEMVSDAVPGSLLLAVRHLPEGSSALARELIVSSATGEQRRLILRCFTTGWQGSPQSKVERESLVLSTLIGSGLPVPQAVFSDPQGRWLGVPAIMQTRLPGRVWWPRAASRSGAIAMGRVLAAIHSWPKPPGLPSARGWVQWTIGHERSRAGWADHPQAAAIEEAIVPALGRVLRRRHVLSHGDFNAGNVLWLRGELSGVLDWEAAESAPPAADVGACRFDLAVTIGTAASDAFVEGYGTGDRDLWFWELLTALKFISFYREWLAVWHRFGLPQLDRRTVRRRIDEAIADALRRAA